LSQGTNDFSIEHIVSFEDTELLITPDLWLLDDIVLQIDQAEKRVYLEVYIFTERDMRDAIIRAHKRWIEVKVLLENNPYKAPYLNDSHYRDLEDAGVNVAWSDPLNYSLNHSKLLIIDESAYVSTGNFSYSLFKYNRDLLVRIIDREFLDVLVTLFLWDFTHKNIWIYHENLVLSPDYSRSKMTNLVLWAQQSIDFYFPYLADDQFQEVLFKMANSWVKIRWIVDKTFYKENPDIVELYSEKGIELREIKKWKLHAKSIIVDKQIAYIGSINFSTYSFDENREIGLILGDSQVIEKLLEIFSSDL
jgi:phosphatidylserine/phosphatidylglycerophosphate/cardiolipin synthase-like enzyme